MRKAQASMEFLSTHIVVILVLVLSIGAISYYGISTMNKSLPSQCILPDGMNCLDHSFHNGKLTLVVQNNMGSKLMINSIEASGCKTNYLFAYLINSDQTTITLDCDGFDGNIMITYTKLNTGLIYHSPGYCGVNNKVTTIEPSIPITDEGYCRNANNYGLCEMVDVFTDSSEYRNKCCSEWSLCCY